MDKYIYGMQKKRASRRGKNVPETTHNVSPPLKASFFSKIYLIL